MCAFPLEMELWMTVSHPAPWEPNLGTLKEQQVLFPTQLSLLESPRNMPFRKRNKMNNCINFCFFFLNLLYKGVCMCVFSVTCLHTKIISAYTISFYFIAVLCFPIYPRNLYIIVYRSLFFHFSYISMVAIFACPIFIPMY